MIRTAFVIVLCCVLPLAVLSSISNSSTADTVVSTTAEVPVWYAGYKWTYDDNIKINTYPRGTWLQLTGESTYIVRCTEDYFIGTTTFRVYNLTIEGIGTGTGETWVDYGGYRGIYPYDITNGRREGYKLYNVSDLGFVYEYLHEWGDITIHLGFGIDATGTIDYYKYSWELPVSEDFDFPMNVGDSFESTNIYYEYGYYVVRITSPVTYTETAEHYYVYPKELYTDPISIVYEPVAGTLEQYNVTSHNRYDNAVWIRWYNKTAESYTNETGRNIKYESGGITNWTNYSKILKSYSKPSPSSDTITITAQLSQKSACENDIVYVNGSVYYTISGIPVQNEYIYIEIFGHSQWIGMTDNYGDYSVQITVPLVYDCTRTTYDISSIGLVCYLYSAPYTNYTVVTLTIIPTTIPNFTSFISIIAFCILAFSLIQLNRNKLHKF